MSKTKSQWAVWSRTPTGRIRATEAGDCAFPMDELRRAVLAHAPASVDVGRYHTRGILVVWNNPIAVRPCPQHKPFEVTR